MEQAEPNNEKTELVKETKLENLTVQVLGAGPGQEKTGDVKETKLEDFPVEVLVRIFNFLPNHDIRCGVALVCKEFQKISQDESLVPVKDLSIKGHYYKYWSGGDQFYGLRNIGGIFDIILNSKYLTTLKIKALKYESIYHLVSTALQVCPKLIHLEIVDTFAQSHETDEQGSRYPVLKKIFESILAFGNGLCVINLKMDSGCGLGCQEKGKYHSCGYSFDWIFDDYISKGCPKIKSLSVESLDLSGDSDQFGEICESAGFCSLSKGCKELKNLKLTKICLGDANTYKETVKEMFPNCNVEIINCVKYKYKSLDTPEKIPYEDDYDSDISWETSDYEQDSDSEFEELFYCHP